MPNDLDRIAKDLDRAMRLIENATKRLDAIETAEDNPPEPTESEELADDSE